MIVLAALIPGFVGALLLALGGFFWFRTKNFVERSQETQGMVTDLIYDSDSEGSGYYTVFRFTTLTGQTVEVTGNIRSNPPGHKLGELIDVLYDPTNPGDARIKKTSTLYFVPMLLGGLGIAFLCTGLFFFVFGVFNLATNTF